MIYLSKRRDSVLEDLDKLYLDEFNEIIAQCDKLLNDNSEDYEVWTRRGMALMAFQNIKKP